MNENSISTAENVSEKIIYANIVGLTLSWIIWNPFQSASMTYWQVFLYALGATPFIISLISAVSQISLSIARFPGGYMADKIGRKRLIVSMTYVIAFTYLLMYYADTWEIIFLAYLVMNICLFYQPALNAIIADSLPQSKRARGFAIINVLPSIVIIFAPYIALFYISKHGIVQGTKILFLLSFIFGLIASTIRLVFLKETMTKKEEMPKNLLGDMKAEYSKAFKIIMKRMKHLLIGYSFVGIAMGLTYLMQLYALRYLFVTEEQWAYIQIISFAFYLVMTIPLSYITDRIGRRPPTIFAAILATIGTILLATAPIGEGAYIIVLISNLLQSLAWSFASSTLPSIEADLLPKEIRGKGYAVINLVNSFVWSISQLIGGYIYMSIGPRTPFYISSIFWLFSLVAFMFIPETIRRK
ncbi:MAG: MFS transporter [Candidatus Njordarchaeota archaeon]